MIPLWCYFLTNGLLILALGVVAYQRDKARSEAKPPTDPC